MTEHQDHRTPEQREADHRAAAFARAMHDHPPATVTRTIRGTKADILDLLDEHIEGARQRSQDPHLTRRKRDWHTGEAWGLETVRRIIEDWELPT